MKKILCFLLLTSFLTADDVQDRADAAKRADQDALNRQLDSQRVEDNIQQQKIEDKIWQQKQQQNRDAAKRAEQKRIDDAAWDRAHGR